jgi:hypothetical protein
MCPVAASVSLAMTMMAMEVRLEAELGRFPPRKVTDSWVEFTDNHIRWISAYAMQSRDKDEVYCFNWLMEAVRSQIPWSLLQDAQNRTLGIISRNSSFIKLRAALGHDAFIQGLMPPAVPLSRFREGKPPLGTPSAPGVVFHPQWHIG